MKPDDSEWTTKGGTLTDGTAQKEFGLTRDEIVQAIRAGALRYKEASIYGNPALRLLRREVEALVQRKRGKDYLADRQQTTRLAAIDREIKQLKKRIAALEKERSKLLG